MSVIQATHPYTASVSKAVTKLIKEMKEPSYDIVPLEAAVNRILATDVESPFALPPFRRAAMDGYAIHAAVAAGASRERPIRLPIIAEIRAGQTINAAIVGDSLMGAIRIFTGAPIPGTYDTVVVQEMAGRWTDGSGNAFLQLDRSFPKGQHVAAQGEDVPQGMKLLYPGTPLHAKEIGILASFGFREAIVYRKPVVAVIPVGDELLLPGEPLSPGKIYDANSFMVSARLRELGAAVRQSAPVADCLLSIQSALREALEEADMVITIGGVSVGDYDYVKQAAENIGGEPLFTKVLMRPGTPTSAYEIDDKRIICLSGNPSACYTGLELLVRPAVLKISGRHDCRPEWLDGRLLEGISKPSPYPRYARAFVYRSEGQWLVELLSGDKSGNIAAFARANALVCLPAGGAGAAAGDEVRFWPLTV
jgi:molybdopterin molybdotransferase